MIKTRTLGGLDVAKNNPVLKTNKATKNYSFITDADGDVYLIANTIAGDKTYAEDVVLAAGEFLNGFLVKAWEGLELVIDGKHIDDNYEDIEAGTLLTVATDGGLEIADEAPETGVYFKVTGKCALTEPAVIAKVKVALGE